MPQRMRASVRRDVYSPQQPERSAASSVVEPLTAMAEDWNRAMSGMYDSWMQAVRTGWEPYLQQAARATEAVIVEPLRGEREHRYRQTCGCEEYGDCCHDDCTCRCCIGDVDLVINSRVGERRVVPVVIENSSRREREIELELSDWTTRGGQAVGAQVSATFLSPLKFSLPACSEEALTLLVQSIGSQDNANELNSEIDNPDAENNVDAVNRLEQTGRRLGDVDQCRVFTADLRVKGCDMRTIRIAVVLLPRDCEPFEIDCRCGCC
jgi:hypothetical protein